MDHEKFIEEHGYSVHPYIITDNLIVSPEEIGTFVILYEDDTEDFTDFGVVEMNFILREFEGWCEVLIDEDTLYDDLIEPIYDEDNNNKVIIKFLDEEEYQCHDRGRNTHLNT